MYAWLLGTVLLLENCIAMTLSSHVSGDGSSSRRSFGGSDGLDGRSPTAGRTCPTCVTWHSPQSKKLGKFQGFFRPGASRQRHASCDVGP